MIARGLVARLRREWGGYCVLTDDAPCDGPLEFAHLPGKPTGLFDQGRGSKARYYDVKNNPGNYVLICRGHHSRLDQRGGRGSAEYARTKEAAA